MNIFVKHIIRLKNTMVRHLKILSLKIQYGNQIKLEKFHFRDGFHVYIENNGVLKVGRGCFFNVGCSITVRKKVSIGSNCIFGENVKILGKSVIKSEAELFNSKLEKVIVEEKVLIENSVVENSVVLKNCKIKDYSIIKNQTIAENLVIENEKRV